MDEYSEEFIGPEERLEMVTDIIARAVLRLIDDGESGIVIEKKQPEPIVLKKRRVAMSPKRKEIEEFLKTKDIINILKISRTTLWRLRKRKKTSFYKIVGSTSIRYCARSELMRQKAFLIG